MNFENVVASQHYRSAMLEYSNGKIFQVPQIMWLQLAHKLKIPPAGDTLRVYVCFGVILCCCKSWSVFIG
jgi:hypothetical protein